MVNFVPSTHRHSHFVTQILSPFFSIIASLSKITNTFSEGQLVGCLDVCRMVLNVLSVDCSTYCITIYNHHFTSETLIMPIWLNAHWHKACYLPLSYKIFTMVFWAIFKVLFAILYHKVKCTILQEVSH